MMRIAPILKALFQPTVTISAPPPSELALAEVGAALETRARRLFGRAMTIRAIDAGSCNGCELEIRALDTPAYDMERFGLRFAASPRHADVLLVTGAVTRNIKAALERAIAATPDPKWIVAVGDCASGCGVFGANNAVIGSLDDVTPVDLHIRGCPPRPIELLSGLIALMKKATARSAKNTV